MSLQENDHSPLVITALPNHNLSPNAFGMSFDANTCISLKMVLENLVEVSSALFVFQKVLEPYNYIDQVPGLKFLEKSTVAFNYWLRIPDDKLQELGRIVNVTMNSVFL